MYKIILIVFSIFASTTVFSQGKYKPGYIIKKDGVRSEALIRQNSQSDSPSKIYVKNTKNNEPREYRASDLKEFRIADELSYISALVKIDLSSDEPKKFSRERAPNFELRRVFLKELVEDSISLYEYRDNNLTRYFYSTDHTQITPLVYKRYLNGQQKVASNNSYKQTLSNQFDCDAIDSRVFKNLKYQSRSLIALFKDYNNCLRSTSNYVSERVESLDRTKSVRFALRVGARFNAFEFNNENTSIDFDTAVGFQISLEFIYATKFTNYNWSFLLDTSYSALQKDLRIFQEFDNETYNFRYSVLEISPGTRYQIPLSHDFSLYGNVFYGLPLVLIDDIGSSNEQNITEFEGTNFIMYGVGFRYKKYWVDLRFQSSRDILATNSSSFQSFSTTLGYSF